MTIGSKVLTWSHSIVPTESDYNCASWYITTTAAKPTGRYFSKTWSGTDDPPTRPEYYRVEYRFNGRIYHKKIRVGGATRVKRADHPYTTEIVSIQSTVFARATYGLCNTGWPAFTNYTTLKNVYVNDSFGSQNPGVTAEFPWGATDDLAILGRLRTAVAGNEINFGVFLGEGRDALRMIAKNATRIATALIALRRGQWDRAARALDLKNHKPAKVRASDRWLEMQYGWLPLLSDVYNGAEFLARTLDAPFVKTYRVRYKRPGKLTPVPYTKPNIAECSTTTQLIARLTEVDVPMLVGLTDPLSVAWELVPFSFIADWFLPIGNYLAARGLSQSLTGTFVTTKTKRSRLRTDNYTPPGNIRYVNYFVDYTYVKVERSVSTSLSVPLPSFKPLSKALSWKHCVNAVALITSIFAKK